MSTTTTHIERDDAVKALRAALRERTGHTWSVTVGRGTAWGWIEVTAPPARRVDGRTTMDDALTLGEIFGLRSRWENCRTVSISPEDRAEYVRRAREAADLYRAALALGGPAGEAARAKLDAVRSVSVVCDSQPDALEAARTLSRRTCRRYVVRRTGDHIAPWSATPVPDAISADA